MFKITEAEMISNPPGMGEVLTAEFVAVADELAEARS